MRSSRICDSWINKVTRQRQFHPILASVTLLPILPTKADLIRLDYLKLIGSFVLDHEMTHAVGTTDQGTVGFKNDLQLRVDVAHRHADCHGIFAILMRLLDEKKRLKRGQEQTLVGSAYICQAPDTQYDVIYCNPCTQATPAQNVMVERRLAARWDCFLC
jgi:hypothetical protein